MAGRRGDGCLARGGADGVGGWILWVGVREGVEGCAREEVSGVEGCGEEEGELVCGGVNFDAGVGYCFGG